MPAPKPDYNKMYALDNIQFKNCHEYHYQTLKAFAVHNHVRVGRSRQTLCENLKNFMKQLDPKAVDQKAMELVYGLQQQVADLHEEKALLLHHFKRQNKAQRVDAKGQAQFAAINDTHNLLREKQSIIDDLKSNSQFATTLLQHYSDKLTDIDKQKDDRKYQVDQSQAQIPVVQHTIVQLQQQLHQAESKNSDQVQALTNQLTQAQQQLQDAQINLTRNQQQYDLLTAQHAQLQQGLDQKQSQNAQLEAQYLQIERELQTSQNELKAQINEQTANEHSIQQLQGEVNELKQQNKDLHALVAQNGQLSTQTLARYTNQIAQLQSQLEAKENELHRHQSLQDNVNDQIFNLQSTITTQHTQLDKLQALNVTLVAQLEAAHRQIGELHESQLTAVNEYHQAQTNLRVLQSERKDTSGVEAQMREMEARYDNLQGQMRDNAARSQDLQNQLQQALASNTTLQIQIQTLHADAVQKNHDLQAARDALTLAQQSHAVLNQNQQFQEQQLQLQINELKSKVSKSKGKNKQVNAQLSDLQGELARVVQQGNQNNDDKKTIEGLQQQIEREKQEHNRLHAEILQLQTDYQSEKAENKSLAAGQKDKTICQAQLENLQYRISQIQPLNKRLTDKLIETEDKLKECHENLAESKNNHQEDIESLEQQYGATETALKQQIENLRAEIDTLQETLNQPANAQSRLSIVFEELDEKAKANPYGASMHLQDEFQILNHKDLDKIVKEFHRKYPNKCKAPASTRVDLNLSVVEKSVDFKRKQVADYLVTCGYTVTVTKVFL